MVLTYAAVLLILYIILRDKRARKKIAKALLVAVWFLAKGIYKISARGFKRIYAYLNGVKGLKPTKEEKRILHRLTPKQWDNRAQARGLDKTLTGKAKLTDSGITVPVRMGDTWNWKKFRDAELSIRNLLGCRTDLRIDVNAGQRGGWAELWIRTRSAADGDDLTWTPETRSFGVNTVTGQQVTIDIGRRLLIAGMSGAGKSVSSRPLMADASEGPTNKLVIIDLKMIEGRLWDHRARVASRPNEVRDLVEELLAEMFERQELLPKGQDHWTPTESRPRLTVVVDEGAEVMSSVSDAVEDLATIARMGRAAEINLWWMTQKPTMSGKGAGIDPQIAAQISSIICLCVRTPGEARTVLGEDATDKGWKAEELPIPGHAYVRFSGSKPEIIKVRYMDKADVMSLPDRDPWRRSKPDRGETGPVRLSKPLVTLTKAPAKTDPIDLVTEALRASEGPVKTAELFEAAGVAKSTGYELVNKLIEKGLAKKAGHGRVELA